MGKYTALVESPVVGARADLSEASSSTPFLVTQFMGRQVRLYERALSFPLLDILSAPQRVALYVGAGALASLAGVAVIRLQARVKSSHGSAAKANVNKTK